METENKSPEEEKKSVGDAAPGVPNEVQAETATETPSEASAETTEGTAPETAEDAPESEPEQSEGTPETETEPETAPSEELEALRSENARLKAQLEAHGAGFKAEYIEDAVLIAGNAAERDGTTITEALQAVAKKYPEWKYAPGDSGKGGFKVGAEAPKEDKAADDDRLDEAFGLRKK